MATLIDLPVPVGYELAMIFNLYINSTTRKSSTDFKVLDEELFTKSVESNHWFVGTPKVDWSRSIDVKCKFIVQHMRKSSTGKGSNVEIQMDLCDPSRPGVVTGSGIGITLPASTDYFQIVEPERTLTLHYGDGIWAMSGKLAKSDEKISATGFLYVKK